jgi:hypothetical protein
VPDAHGWGVRLCFSAESGYGARGERKNRKQVPECCVARRNGLRPARLHFETSFFDGSRIPSGIVSVPSVAMRSSSECGVGCKPRDGAASPVSEIFSNLPPQGSLTRSGRSSEKSRVQRKQMRWKHGFVDEATYQNRFFSKRLRELILVYTSLVCITVLMGPSAALAVRLKGCGLGRIPLISMEKLVRRPRRAGTAVRDGA